MDRNAYYQLPKFLFEGGLEHLSNDARVLYSLLRDRHDLLMSIRNDWAGEGEEGGVYLTFSRESMCEMMKLSRPTITKAMNDLKRHGLIEERRPGMGQTNRIYLLPTSADRAEEPPPEAPEAVDEAYWEMFFLS